MNSIERATWRTINRHIARELAFIMEGETNQAFRSKSWGGVAWAPVRYPVRRGSLMIRSGALRRSLSFRADGNVVTVSSSLPYATLHNEGGRVTVPVTPEMRRYWWAQYYKAKNKKEQARYRAMALSRKSHWQMQIPQRQFVGITDETERRLDARINELLDRLELGL